MPVTFDPIGKVKVENGNRFIELDEDVFKATLGLDEYSHMQVIWWMHLYDSEEARKYYVLEKPYTKGPEKIGVFATRSPVRPCPIGITACRILEVDGKKRRIKVDDLDAEDKTPVLDIKPYEPSIDRVRDAGMPAWCRHWPGFVEENEGFDWGEEFNFPG
jgi:tRNA-Thr(GGU) m(6)t(6)A37 methyltransferase TsaA